MVAEAMMIAEKQRALLAQARPSPSMDAPSRRAKQKPPLSEIAELVAESPTTVHRLPRVDLSFTVHEASGEIMVTVKDEATGKVIREIPSSELLDLAAKIDEMTGIVFDQTG